MSLFSPVDVKHSLFVVTLVLGCLISGHAQIVPILNYDPNNGQIISAFHLLPHCSEIAKPVVGRVIGVRDSKNAITLRLSGVGAAAANNLLGPKDDIELPLINFPEHISENFRTYLLSKGNYVKAWLTACEEGGGVSIIHITATTGQGKPTVVPAAIESISPIKTSDAIARIKEIEDRTRKKIRAIKQDFDREIAPSIPTGEKGEFESTVEYKIRIAKLNSLRKANSSRYWKKVYEHTHSDVKEYLVLKDSLYSSPIKLQLGTYDADTERFSVRTPIHRGPIEISVRRPIAPLLKQNFDNAAAFVDSRILFLGPKCGWFASPERLRIVYNKEIFFDFWENELERSFTDDLFEEYSFYPCVEQK